METPHPPPVIAGWEVAPAAPGAVIDPSGLAAAGLDWAPAAVPGTVASALDAPLDQAGDLEAQDWWFRCVLDHPGPGNWALEFGGLATLAQVWLNGAPILSSRNMFRRHRVDVTRHLGPSNTLVIRCASLTAALQGRRPRPRWKTRLVTEQKLRWVRTSLLGRIPGWTPRLPAIGPWRGVTWAPVDAVGLEALSVTPGVTDGVATLEVTAQVRGGRPTGAVVLVGDRARPLEVEGDRITGRWTLPELPLWWPHTHGAPARVRVALRVETDAGDHTVDLGMVGFRAVELRREGGEVRVVVNGVPVFCRGACWTVTDPRSLDGPPGETRRTLAVARAAGLNMIRVGGTMTWPSDELVEACDAMGILLWQDLMLANMDYPFDDEAFMEELQAEIVQQLARLRPRACVAVLCGGSEIAQQAAMLGLPEASWWGPFFTELLPALLAQHLPGVPYVPGTPSGGALPFHTGTGLSHYYGVGAYRRPLTDPRLAGVRFSPECLGFSHVPDDETIELMDPRSSPAPHDPRWKAGVPRDSGAGWDFEDVRDHYVRTCFGLDPVALRATDPRRYLAVSRAVTSELLLRVFAEWRRPGGSCGGGLVWFLRDLRLGAGWGLLDSTGRGKPALWAARRAWAPQGVWMTDEGLDGLALHVLNDSPEPLRATVELSLLRGGSTQVAHGSAPVEVPAHGGLTLSGDRLLGRFTDLSWAYRFGPPGHEVVAALLRGPDGAVLHQDCLFPAGWSLPMVHGAVLEGTAEAEGDAVVLTLQAKAFLQALTVTSRGHVPDDNGFHLIPGVPRRVEFRPAGGRARGFKVHLTALNWAGSLTVRA